MAMEVKSMKITRLLLCTLFLGVLIGSAHADAVTDWNLIAVQSVVAAGPARPGPSGALDIAMVHAAVYDAVQAIEGEFQPYYVDIPDASGSPVAATAAAAHDVLVSRFPAQVASLDVTYQNYLASNGILPTDPGIAVGQRAAAGIIALRACDGAFPNPAPPPFVGGTAIGQWRPTGPTFSPMNPGPWLGSVTPWTLTRPFQFRSDPPPALTSLRYARDYIEVKAFGALNGSSRTPDQTDMAFFWAGNFTVMMNATLRQVSDARVDDIADSSRLFAMATMASADTVIATWNDKAHFVFWRPDTAIHNGNLDGNPFTVADATWAPLIPNPPYPDYGSGANGYTASTMHALQRFFGRDRVDLTITTTNIGPTTQDTRSFRRFSDVMDEVVDARVLLGIHFRFADTASRDLGKKVARYGDNNYFRRVGDHDDGHHN
jgi:hypothetical protein